MSGWRGRGRPSFARGRGRGGHASAGGSSQWPSYTGADPQLVQALQRIDGQQYGRYKDLVGNYTNQSPHFLLAIDHVQSDPYAPPSRIRAIISTRDAGFPPEYWQTSNQTKLSPNLRQTALCDYISRVAGQVIHTSSYDRQSTDHGGWNAPKGGNFTINAPDQQVLPRTSCVCNEETGQIELRFSATLPAAGRTILGLKAATLLCDWIPQIVRAALLYSNQDRKKLFLHIQYVEDQEFLRGQLSSRGLVAFVANGSVLPRKSGVSSLPMSSNVVRFTSPPELEVQLDSPHAGRITGMGIPKGITVLTGGGFHGKSTLLEALQLGIYNVVHGDGRERVVSDTTSVKIRAEDGRSVSGVNISPFISNLPGGKGTRSFSTEDASGSTSMAANIIEAVELGAKTLLIDEDASATNMLVRDARMSTLIKAEPITPLISRVRALYTRHGVSTIIVVGGLGDWLTVADNVIGMQDYVPRLLNSDAAEVIRHFPTQVEQLEDFHSLSKRRVCVPGHLIGHKGPMAKSKELIMFPNARRAPFAGDTAADGNGEGREEAPVSRDMGEQELDLSALEQLVERGQAKTIAVALRNFTLHPRVELHQTAKTVEQSKLARMDMGGDLVAVRALEVGMAVGRLRGLLVE